MELKEIKKVLEWEVLKASPMELGGSGRVEVDDRVAGEDHYPGGWESPARRPALESW